MASAKVAPAESLSVKPRSLKAAQRQTRPRSATSPARRTLEQAFRNFTDAAGTLERSYAQLQNEVLRLRFELERTNKDLQASLDENSRMRAYLGKILEGLPCGVLVAGPEGEARVANPEARRLLAIGEGEIRMQGGTSLAPPAQMLREMVRESREKCTVVEQEYAFETEHGERAIGLSCVVLGNREGEGAANESVFLLRDLTDERRELAEKESTRRRESLAQLATLLAHEIRNPLGSLELFAGLLADAAAQQPNLRKWTDHVQAGLRGLSATVNNVLQFHAQAPPQLAPVNLGRLLRDSVEFLRPLARRAGLHIDLQNALGEVEIAADSHRLQQAFFNLALNAFRAMSIDGTLTIRLGANDGRGFDAVRIEFQDTGKGIAPENLSRMFGAGFTTTPGQPGIGLAVCKAVVEQHGGSISAASEVGKGATFSIVLPRNLERMEGAA